MDIEKDFLDKTYQISPWKVIKYILKHMAVIFWGISIVPFYMAWVFASHDMFPIPSWEAEFIHFALGLIVIGPLLGGATLLYNDYWDYKMDKLSKRKSDFPLPRGLIKRTTIFRVAVGFFLIAIFLSLFISLFFTLIVLLIIFLSIIYSAQPIRIKNRPGLDVILNASGSGILCSFAGWILVEPITNFPFLWLIPMFTGVASVYLPTTIIDYDSDKKNGVNTIAVHLGQKNAFYLGLLNITIANATIIFMGIINYIISFEFVIWIWPIALAQIIIYWLILRYQTFKNVFRTIIALSILLTFGNILLLLYYTGHIVI
jgi:chlorophyll synthase